MKNAFRMKKVRLVSIDNIRGRERYVFKGHNRLTYYLDKSDECKICGHLTLGDELIALVVKETDRIGFLKTNICGINIGKVIKKEEKDIVDEYLEERIVENIKIEPLVYKGKEMVEGRDILIFKGRKDKLYVSIQDSKCKVYNNLKKEDVTLGLVRSENKLLGIVDLCVRNLPMINFVEIFANMDVDRNFSEYSKLRKGIRLKDSVENLLNKIDYNIVYIPRYKLSKMKKPRSFPVYMGKQEYRNLLGNFLNTNNE